MSPDKKTKLIQSLSSFREKSKKMQIANYSLSTVKSFKKYYNSMHLDLIEHVVKSKDKGLSNLAKQLHHTKDVFRHTDKWIGLLSLAIVFPGIALIYLYTIDIGNSIMLASTIVSTLLVFILIKKVQSQPHNLKDKLNKIALVCDKIIVYLRKNSN